MNVLLGHNQHGEHTLNMNVRVTVGRQQFYGEILIAKKIIIIAPNNQDHRSTTLREADLNGMIEVGLRSLKLNVRTGHDIILHFSNQRKRNVMRKKIRAAIGYGIVQKKICDESADVDEAHCNTWIQETLPALLAPYDEKDVFNADETGLFFKCLPDKTLSFKNEKCYEGKLSKERVTCLLAANMTGIEKLKIVLIGKSAKPRCFRGVTSLPLTYKSNKKAWMPADLFESWLLELDKYFLRQNRKVLLIIDNCPAHPQLNHKLRVIKLTFFPPNMTSKLQPLDQGIINCFKLHYRQRILKTILDSFESHCSILKIDFLDCINIVANVWNVDVTQTTIHNCFRKAGFGIHNFYDQEDEIPLAQVRKKIIQEQQMTSNIEDMFNRCVELCNVDHPTSMDEFVNVDDNLITSKIATDEKIVASISNQDEHQEIFDESDTDDIPRKKPSLHEMSNAFETLQLFFNMNENTTDDIFVLLDKLKKFYELDCEKNAVHQKLITDYFKK
ncbi:tigger transposable element-derived protein 6-like [Euwallacea similis]|uniref:tigger transposable element-derived protein 6-like n=1 Tax=Euwallacea similis TaxID=1736056 RepID=UPI0034500A67